MARIKAAQVYKKKAAQVNKKKGISGLQEKKAYQDGNSFCALLLVYSRRSLHYAFGING
ncbi:MAG: hypothetical protein K6C30_03115 [Bacteroidaceae bacterium]|nr:hypothetical protein [Bacteroidaceae bacterium]